jgi:predicted MFS family arabinose efflux permease
VNIQMTDSSKVMNSVSGLTSPHKALRFVLAFGAVSLFADMTYEGMRAISGPYLALLGASGVIVGLVAGLGEFLGYTLRLVSGSLADRSRLYWPITLSGYTVQMLAVPALALVHSWPAAAGLIILERIGKAARNPPRDVMLAEAGEQIGQGWAFGLHEALDQSGAMIGPLIAAAVLALRHDYHAAFAWLLAPAIAALLLVYSVRIRYPEAGQVRSVNTSLGSPSTVFPSAFWFYAVGAAMVGFGFADYSLMSYGFAETHSVSTQWIPIFYAVAMGISGAGSLIFGKLFDRRGLMILLPVTFVVAAYAPLVFFGGQWLALAGIVLWGLGTGIHESVMSAAIAKMVPPARRARAYGLFTAIFGISWFAGSIVLGALYDRSRVATVVVATAIQLCALLPLLIAARRLGVRAP